MAAVCLALALIGIAIAGPAVAQEQDGYTQAPFPSHRAGDVARNLDLLPQDLFLEVFHDERPIARLAHVRLRKGRLSATAEQLQAIGLMLPGQPLIDADSWIALDTLPGLTYRYDPSRQHLYLSIPPSLRPTQALGYQPPQAVQAQRDSGWLLGYDSYGRLLGDDYSLALGHTLRRFGPGGALETRGSLRAGDSGSGYRRLDSFWIYSDPERLWTWTAGDLISGGLPWTRPVRMAGFQWRRNFAVRPDLVTLPMPRFSADATVPSAVDLYINNIRQFGSQVQDGPFVLDALPRISGAGQATLVVTDHLGRTSQTSVPLYVDQQRLAPGLTDFSLEAGLLRHGYGSDQDGYRGSPVASASWRRGITDTLTLESHGEVGSDLRMAGLGAVWSPAGRWGLLTGSYARSDSDRQGSQYSLGYQWYSQRIGLDLQRLRRDASFRDLGDIERIDSDFQPSLMLRDRATAWLPLARGSLSLSWLRQRNGHNDDFQTIRSLSWNQIFGQHLSASATVFDSDGDRGIGISLSRSFGDRLHGHAQVSHDDDRSSGQIGLRRTAPYQGGWGWDVRAGHRSGAHGQASAQVLGR
ncbi:MAG: fimbria/pilus outer membrane usher protein, partial [Lysobacterales bacterium]